MTVNSASVKKLRIVYVQLRKLSKRRYRSSRTKRRG